MKLFSKDNTDEQKPAEHTKAPAQKAATQTMQKGVRTDGDVALLPLVTEKAHSLTDHGTYAFRVQKGATKGAVRKAVEAAYGVTVQAVRVINMPRRKRTIGRNRGYKPSYRKALVTLKSGDKIDFFEGV